MASETCGRVSVTILWNTVSESRMVTPAKKQNRQDEYGEKKEEQAWKAPVPSRIEEPGRKLSLDLSHPADLRLVSECNCVFF